MSNQRSNISTTTKWFVLTGFPKDTTVSDVISFLPEWFYSMSADHSIIRMRRHRRTASAVVQISPYTKRTYKKLCAFLRERRFEQSRQIGIQPYTSSTVEDSSSAALEGNRTPSSHSSENKDARKEKNRELSNLARSFLKFVQNENVEVCNRDRVSVLFRTFHSSSAGKAMTPQQLVAKEISVLTKLRQLKLLKRNRPSAANNNTAITIFCDESGRFPSIEERRSEIQRIREEQEVEEQDKENIIVSKLPDRIYAEINEETTIAFDVQLCSMDGKEDSEKQCVLEDIEILGARSRMFRVSIPKSLPSALGSIRRTKQVELKVTPTQIGLLRARARFCFEGFVIVRSITVSCGRAKLFAVLQPTAPYKRKVKNYYKKKAIDPVSVSPPTTARGENPLATLPHYNIPAETVDGIQSQMYDSVLDSIGWSPTSTTTDDDNIEGYGEYWQHLLWVSEYQNLMDIQLFDMEEAELQREGKYYHLTVPGLAEGRPSVLRGDFVHVTFQNRLYKGRVHAVKLLQVVLEFHSTFGKVFHPSIDRAHVRFTFSRTTLRTSHRACKELAAKRMGPLMLTPTPMHLEKITSAAKENAKVSLAPWANRNLNQEQQNAVQQVLEGVRQPLPYIIFGPPGTGKTTTVVETVYQLGKKKKKVLLVAPSNDAADILVERLATYFPPSELRRILAYSRGLDSLPTNIRPYSKDMLEPKEKLAEIMSSRIVVSTVNLAARFSFWGVPQGHFDVLCVDEAGHATEPEVIAVASSLMHFEKNGGQLVLAGDPKQLGPIISSDICLKFGLSVSYMERLYNRSIYGRREDGTYPVDLITKLVCNYRSHPALLKLPNEMFYDNDLKCVGDLMVTSNMTKWEHLPKSGFPVVFHALNGDNLRESNSPSWFNPEEAQQVVEYVNLLMNETRPPIREEEIGIITPYARQAQKIRMALSVQGVRNIKVGSVECFQGQERRVILLSTVRSQKEHVSSDLRYNLGFVASPKRFNVAMTRAKALLIVIGSPSVLSMDEKNWLPFLKYCHENQSMVGEHWEPFEAEDDTKEESEPNAFKNEDYVTMDAPSQLVEVEGFTFINREE